MIIALLQTGNPDSAWVQGGIATALIGLMVYVVRWFITEGWPTLLDRLDKTSERLENTTIKFMEHNNSQLERFIEHDGAKHEVTLSKLDLVRDGLHSLERRLVAGGHVLLEERNAKEPPADK